MGFDPVRAALQSHKTAELRSLPAPGCAQLFAEQLQSNHLSWGCYKRDRLCENCDEQR
jgi:hypothetical protein